jgi:ribulose-5-phosphate 4-epimerase/fuculose-1-phosphate aldolase
MSKHGSTQTGSIRDQVSPEEWQVRVDLAACYRLMALYGMTDLIYNHISARVPDTNDELLINPYGYLYEEITASSLLKIDLDGEIRLQPDHAYRLNAAGFVIHSAVHAARHDVECVIHTHTRAGTAVSAMDCGLLPLSQTAMRFYNAVSYHEYEGPALKMDERQRLVADLGDTNAMVLSNHGLLVCGRTIPDAFNRIYALENACRIQVDAMASGQRLKTASDEAAEATAEAFREGLPSLVAGHDADAIDGSLEWGALLRQLDRKNGGYDG